MLTLARQTSLKAFRELQSHLGDMHREVLKFYLDNALFTAMECAKALGYDDPNKVRPRINELANVGLLIEAGKRADKHTGKTCLVWMIKETSRERIKKMLEEKI